MLRRLLARRSRRGRGRPGGVQGPRGPLVPEGSDVIYSYRVGPVEYAIYRHKGALRYALREPPRPPGERLEAILLGLDKPSDEAEAYHARRARSGYGPLYPIITDPNVEEVAYTRHDAPVMVLNRLVPDAWLESNVRLTEEEADSIALTLARKAGRPLSLASPLAEGVTEDGHRVAVTFGAEVSRHGSTFVIRKYPEKPVTIADLIAASTITPLEAAYLWVLLEAQQFILIVGGMGAGKTTLLQGLATLIPPTKRVVTIEDVPELRLPQPGWDSLYTRPAPPGEEHLTIDLEELLKFALRRRADYVIVGEVRGREARLLAQAAAIGHGSLATFHADDASAALARLAMEPISLPPLFLESIGAIVTIRRIVDYDGRVLRKVVEIAEVYEGELRTVFSWDYETGATAPSDPRGVVEASGRLREAWARLGMPSGSPEAELETRAAFLEDLAGVERDEIPRRIASFYYKRYSVRA